MGDYTEAQKAFYSLDYLKAYKDGYEQFVLPHIDQFDTNMHTFTPDQITNSTDLCDIMIEKDADMTHFNNFWHMKNSFRSSGQTSEKYNRWLLAGCFRATVPPSPFISRTLWTGIMRTAKPVKLSLGSIQGKASTETAGTGTMTPWKLT